MERRQGSGTFVREHLVPLPDNVAALRHDLAVWIARAHAANLDVFEIQALVTEVAAGILPSVEEKHRVG